MTRSEYYRWLKQQARDIRAAHGLTGPRVMLTDLRRIYKAYGIELKLWPVRMKSVRGAYFNDDTGPHVMIDKSLPTEQRIFTMAHELKHHVAGDVAGQSESGTEENDPKEIGAEIFAAELIYPEEDFARDLEARGVDRGNCTAEDIVRLKNETRTTLSYTSLGKRAEILGFATKGSLARIKWKTLAESIYGEPEYKRVQRFRSMRAREH